MVGIGMLFAASPNPEARVEETLVRASVEGMDADDLRVLAVLTSWLGVHHRYINADRLVRCVSAQSSSRALAYWAAIARWLSADRRFARLARLHEGPPLELLPVGTALQLARRGEDARFVGSSLRVPDGVLRDRQADVLTPAQLVAQHRGIYNRALMGPTWRADVWSALEMQPEMSVAALARHVGCAFSTAWQVAQDFRLLHGVVEAPVGAARCLQ